MSTSQDKMKALLGNKENRAKDSDESSINFKSQNEKDHPNNRQGKICRGAMCMESKLPEDVMKSHEHALKSTIVDRRNPDNPKKPLMQAKRAHTILKAGTQIDMLKATGIDKENIPRKDSGLIQPKELKIRARWKTKYEESATSGRDANVFGGLGVLVISSKVSLVTIPKMNALNVPKWFLDKYGSQLVPLTEPVELDAVKDPGLEHLYLVEYEWDKDYINDYVMHQQGGGGLFVETHPFPHVFTPLSPDCHGALILGVDCKDGSFDFAAFKIPFGYTMKIASNVIHGDSFFIGPYAIALTETELADSVILKQKVDRGIQPVCQASIKPVKMHLLLLSEYRLASSVNNRMMIDKIRSEGGVGKGVGFFQQLPSEVLSEVRTLSQEAQDAYEFRFGVE